MIPAPFKVVLDADVLYPSALRDTLLRSAAAGIFQAHWSTEILDEASRNLVASGRMTKEQAARLLSAMTAAFPEAAVTGHEQIVDAMKNDPKDRHVAAAAVKVGAQVIVTGNLRDFKELPEGIEAQSPDDFLGNLFDLDPEGMTEILKQQAAALRRPPITFDDLLTGLSKIVPKFAAAVRAHLAGGPPGPT